MYKQSAALYDAIYSFKNYQKEAEKVHNLIQQHKHSPGNTLLDVACGTGNHLVHLQEHYQVQGVDVNPDILKIAREKLPDVKFHQGDMVEFSLKQKFDVITCLFSSIGYARTLPRMTMAFQNMARHLKARGLVIVEPWFSPEAFMPGTLHGLFVDQPTRKISRMNISTVQDNVSIMEMHHLAGTLQGIEYFVERHEMGLFTDREYRKALENSGLDVEYDSEGLTGRGLYIGIKASG